MNDYSKTLIKNWLNRMASEGFPGSAQQPMAGMALALILELESEILKLLLKD